MEKLPNQEFHNMMKLISLALHNMVKLLNQEFHNMMKLTSLVWLHGEITK